MAKAAEGKGRDVDIDEQLARTCEQAQPEQHE